MTLTPMLQWDKITANQIKRGQVGWSRGGGFRFPHHERIVQGAGGDYYLYNQCTVTQSLNHPLKISTHQSHSLMDGGGRHAATHSITLSTQSYPTFNDLFSTVMITTIMVHENCNSSSVANRSKNVDASYNPCNIRRLEKNIFNVRLLASLLK